MKNRFKITVLILCVIICYSCKSKTIYSYEPPKFFEVAHLNTSKYKVSYPKSWNISQVHGYTKTNSLAISNSKGKYSSASFLFLTNNFTTDSTLEEILDYLIRKNLFKGYYIKNEEIISKTFFKDYAEVLAVYKIKDRIHKVLVRYYIKNGVISELRFRTYKESFDAYENYRKLFFDSFVLK